MGPTMAVGTCQRGTWGVVGPVWYVAANTVVPVVQCGGSCSSQTPRQGPVATVLWQQTVRTVERIRRDNKGGIRCDPEVNLQMTS